MNGIFTYDVNRCNYCLLQSGTFWLVARVIITEFDRTRTAGLDCVDWPSDARVSW